MKICKKCGYERQGNETTSIEECPSCGAIYAKVEARLKYLAEEPLRQKQQEIKEREEIEKKKRKQEELRKKRQLNSIFICTECGNLGVPITVTKGSIIIEIIMWLMFLLPGLIYSIWRHISRYNACPECKHESMISVKTPKGKKLLSEFHE